MMACLPVYELGKSWLLGLSTQVMSTRGSGTMPLSQRHLGGHNLLADTKEVMIPFVD